MYPNSHLGRVRVIPDLVSKLMARRDSRRADMAANPRNADNLTALYADVDAWTLAELEALQNTLTSALEGVAQEAQRVRDGERLAMEAATQGPISQAAITSAVAAIVGA